MEGSDIPKQSANFPDLFGTPPSKGSESPADHAISNPGDKTSVGAPLRGIPPPPKEPPPPPPTIGQQSMTIPRTLRERVQPGTSKRSDFPLVREKVHLLIIDVQTYLSQSDGGFFHESLTTMCSNIPKLIQAFRSHRDNQRQGCEIFFTFLQSLTQDARDISLDYKLSGPLLANIPTCTAPHEEIFLESVMPELELGKGDILIPKTSCSVFNSTSIDYTLRNFQGEQLVICGQLTDQCVESAVRDAADLGYFVTVAKDSCAAKSPDAETKGFHGMAGFCRLLSTDQILEELSVDHKIIPNNLQSHAQLEPVDKETTVRVDEAISRKKETPTTLTDKTFTSAQEAAYTLALLYSLQAASVEFIRYLMVDVCNTVRCKAVPLNHLLKNGSSLNYQVSVATVVMAGLPSFADSVLEETGLDASGLLTMQPDLSTMRVLPYARKSALVLGGLYDQGETRSGLCTRGLLQRVAKRAKEEFGIAFVSLYYCTND